MPAAVHTGRGGMRQTLLVEQLKEFANDSLYAVEGSLAVRLSESRGGFQ